MKTLFKKRAFILGLTAFVFAIWALLSLVKLFFSDISKNNETNSVNKSRIIEKYSTVIDGRGYCIVEIDGIEYLCQGGGGITPLVICPEQTQ